MNCLFIYNPVSGKGKIAKIEGKIVQMLGRAFEQVDVYATKGPGEMTRVVAERAGGYGAIVFAGGDAVTGAATVILAMEAGKAGAKGIHEYLSQH